MTDRGPMTPDKCAVHDDVGFDGEHWRCATCGQRFVPEPPLTGTAQAILERHANSVTVPSDVLEEAREALETISAEHFLETLVNARTHGARDAWAGASAALARIDAVSGKK